MSVHEKSNLLLLPLALHDKMTTIGSGLVVLELALEAGLLEGPTNGPHSLATDWEQQAILLFGDAASISNYLGF